MSDERSPLLQFPGSGSSAQSVHLGDHHNQFCHLIGTRPINLPPDQKHSPHPESLYKRAVRQKDRQHRTYLFTATLTNTLILSQVVLGAALTGLGASNSSHILITIFGALNTIIAGLIAWLKSRGQPMRARMFRDDLERVVDEIENSAMMWLGISKNVHGYDKIDTDEQVTVRSEVARLTRLYDRAVKTNTLNEPDMYSTGAPSDPHHAALRSATGQPVLPAPPPVPPPATVPVSGLPPPQETVIAPSMKADPDASPATKAPELPTGDRDKESPGKDESDQTKQVVAPKDDGDSTSESSNHEGAAASSSISAADPDESPASAVESKKHAGSTSRGEDGV